MSRGWRRWRKHPALFSVSNGRLYNWLRLPPAALCTDTDGSSSVKVGIIIMALRKWRFVIRGHIMTGRWSLSVTLATNGDSRDSGNEAQRCHNAFCADETVKETVCVLPFLLFLSHHFKLGNVFVSPPFSMIIYNTKVYQNNNNQTKYRPPCFK